MQTIKSDEVPLSKAVFTLCVLFFVGLIILTGIYALITEQIEPSMLTKEVVPSGGWGRYLTKESACVSLCRQVSQNHKAYPFLNASYHNITDTCVCYISKVNISGFLYVQRRDIGEAINQWNLTAIKN